MDDGSVAVAAEVKVPGHSIDLKEAFHPAPLLAIDVLDDSLKLLVVVHVFVIVDLVVGERNLLEVVFHINQMHL